jgi:hypothetical protein
MTDDWGRIVAALAGPHVIRHHSARRFEEERTWPT